MSYADNIFTGEIDENGVIWEVSTGRKRQVVGIDTQKEQEYQQAITEMQETIDNYYAKLVEIGVIKPPKTAEEIAREAAEQQQIAMKQTVETMKGMQDEINEFKSIGTVMMQVVDTMKVMQGEIKELKNIGYAGNGVGHGSRTIGQDSSSNWEAPRRSKKSIGDGEPNITGVDS